MNTRTHWSFTVSFSILFVASSLMSFYLFVFADHPLLALFVPQMDSPALYVPRLAIFAAHNHRHG